MPGLAPANVTIIHPDLGIGGAERLIIDVALALQNRGHRVTIYTSHCDKSHCFEEARDWDSRRARSRKHHLSSTALRTLPHPHGGTAPATPNRTAPNSATEKQSPQEENEKTDQIFIVDQLSTCVPFLKHFSKPKESERQRILFYCHFPDQLLVQPEKSTFLRLVKRLYRYPFDGIEGWGLAAADKVVANSKFSRRVVDNVFGEENIGKIDVVYPCVDTDEDAIAPEAKAAEPLWGGKKILLSVNRFERKKDMALAIRAYNGLGFVKRQGTRLVIAGGYDNRVQENVQYHRELDELATGLGLKTATSKTVVSALSIPDDIDVLFLLSVPTTFKDTLLLQSKLLLYTPINEHFGIVPVEAMRAGLPVLASNTGGPLETIVDGVTGWLRDAHDDEAWTAIIDKVLYELSETELETIANAGKSRADKEFSLTALGDRLEETISAMLAADRRPFDFWADVLVMLMFVSGVVFNVLVIGYWYYYT
ncbi:Glycosyl transferase family 1 [Penicillium chermesinum]|nr:Glycosyl transferase family 1 [Penicillium chermesinum]